MATNYPPPGAEAAFLAALNTVRFECSTLLAAQLELRSLGWTWRNATPQERNQYWKNVRCDSVINPETGQDEGDHQTFGFYLIDPNGGEHPFGFCRTPGHNAALVLWPPYELSRNTAQGF